jgi:hypothetical protein
MRPLGRFLNFMTPGETERQAYNVPKSKHDSTWLCERCAVPIVLPPACKRFGREDRNDDRRETEKKAVQSGLLVANEEKSKLRLGATVT